MNNTEVKSLEHKEKSYRCPEGPLAWLNDIEITKTPYLGSIILLIINLLLIRKPLFSIDVPYMDSMQYALHEISEFSSFGFAALIMGILSVFCILVPLAKFFEWKYRWFIPVAATSLFETIGAIFLIAKKSELMEKSLIGYAYELLSIEINITASACLLIVVNIMLLVFSVKMLIDVKNNERKY